MEIFAQQNFVADYSIEIKFYSEKLKNLFEPPFGGDFGGNVHTPSIARWKARGRLSISRNWTFFRYLLLLRRCDRKSVEVAVFRRGWVTFGEYVTGKGASPTNHCWRQKTRVIAVSYGIKIFAVRHLVLSQYTHLTDRQTDRRTDGRTDGQTELRQQYRALHYIPHGKV